MSEFDQLMKAIQQQDAKGVTWVLELEPVQRQSAA
jgi:hypothetical protein